MQSSATTTILFRSLATVAMVVVLSATVHASGDATAQPRTADAWMPDVRDRVAELRERTRYAAREAQERGSQESPQRQWWRTTAARPAMAVSR